MQQPSNHFNILPPLNISNDSQHNQVRMGPGVFSNQSASSTMDTNSSCEDTTVSVDQVAPTASLSTIASESPIVSCSMDKATTLDGRNTQQLPPLRLYLEKCGVQSTSYVHYPFETRTTSIVQSTPPFVPSNSHEISAIRYHNGPSFKQSTSFATTNINVHNNASTIVNNQPSLLTLTAGSSPLNGTRIKKANKMSNLSGGSSCGNSPSNISSISLSNHSQQAISIGNSQRRSSYKEIPVEMIVQYLHLPQKDAAKALKVSVSTLKRRFYSVREQIGIDKWPTTTVSQSSSVSALPGTSVLIRRPSFQLGNGIAGELQLISHVKQRDDASSDSATTTRREDESLKTNSSASCAPIVFN